MAASSADAAPQSEVEARLQPLRRSAFGCRPSNWGHGWRVVAARMEANLDLMWGDGGIQLLILSHVFASVEVIRQLQFGCWEAGVGVLDKSARLEYNS
jgi:hypothetical protein